MSVDYDPYSHEAMSDPFALYARLREEAPVYYMPAYDAWALSRFEDVWSASLDQKHFTATGGQSPGQILLGEPIPRTFMTMDLPDHRAHRGLIGADYTKKAFARDAPRIRALAREILAPLLERGSLEVYAEYANRVTTLNAAHMAGVPRSEGEQVRAWIDGMLARERGQVGAGEENGAFAAELDAYLRGLVRDMRADPSRATGHLAVWLTREVDGRRMSDDEVVANLFSIVVTGSETTPLSVAGTLYYLDAREEQKAEVLDDASNVSHAFAESLRFDQPTNILGRKVKRDVELGGQKLREGQGVLFLYASANRDEREFPRADRYDIHRRPRRTLSFGHGIHKCLGEFLGMGMGVILLEELLGAIGQYTLEPGDCERLYGEFLSGFCRVPIRFEPTSLPSG